VQHYAESIFALGEELADTLQRRPTGKALRLRVGITDGVPKLVAFRLLEPAFHLGEPVHLVVREAAHERLLAELALHRLDVVLSDAPTGSSTRVKSFDHLLGETPMRWFAAPRLAARLRRRFPASLEAEPVLLPPAGTALRSAQDTWFEAQGLRPRIVAELDDSALADVMGQQGLGVFPAPEVIAAELRRQHGVVSLGRIRGVAQRFHAITVERRLQHPAVAALTSAARRELFG
jgi:LysR family transcriptional activator of nhaA